MALHLWDYRNHFRNLPSIKSITRRGRRNWDLGVEYIPASTSTTGNHRTIFTIPSFARHGRWGNMVFQYIFIRILALNNNGEIELYRAGDELNSKLSLYDDMLDIPNIQTKSDIILLDSYHVLVGRVDYFPSYYWRAMFISNVRLQKCFILRNVDEAINKPLSLPDKAPMEVEGLFMVSPRLYKQQHKEFILNKLFQLNVEFNSIIQDCINKLGQNKTIIGIHIRRGDFIYNPLGNPFQFPIVIKYIIKWLVSNI